MEVSVLAQLITTEVGFRKLFTRPQINMKYVSCQKILTDVDSKSCGCVD